MIFMLSGLIIIGTFTFKIEDYVQDVYNEFPPALFNPNDPGSQPLLFQATITNLGESTPFELSISIQWRDVFLIEKAIILHENDFYGSIVLTSRDLISEEPPAGYESHGTYKFDDLLTGNPEFEDGIRSGSLPDGDYIIAFRLFELGSNNAPSEENNYLSQIETVAFTVMKPTLIQLSSPGLPFGYGIGTTPNPYPDFVWTSNLHQFTLKLFELTPFEFTNQVDSPEDIENQFEPYLVQNNINSTILPYPSGAGELRNDRIYAWQICADLISISGITNEEYKSAMYIFMISEDTEIDLELIMFRNTMEFLQQLEIEGVEEIIRLLESGFSFDDVRQGTSSLTINELCDVLSSGDKNIKKITIR